MIVCVYLCVCVCISARVLKAAVGATPEQRAADRKRSLQKKAEKARTVAAVAETEGKIKTTNEGAGLKAWVARTAAEN